MRKFAQFLDLSWNAAHGFATSMEQVESTEFMSDWAQANWEILVETPFRELCGFGDQHLEPYGDGVDCNDASSRVWNPGVLPTHRVVCRTARGTLMLDLLTGRSLDAAEIPVVFDHFATKSAQGWHEQVAPFDCVLAYQGEQEVLIHLDQVSFVLEKLSESGR